MYSSAREQQDILWVKRLLKQTTKGKCSARILKELEVQKTKFLKYLMLCWFVSQVTMWGWKEFICGRMGLSTHTLWKYLIFLNPIISCQSPVTWKLTPHWRKELFILYPLLLEVKYLDNSDHGTWHKVAHSTAYSRTTIPHPFPNPPRCQILSEQCEPIPYRAAYPTSLVTVTAGRTCACTPMLSVGNPTICASHRLKSDIHTLLLTTFTKRLEITTQGLEAVMF